MSSQPHLHGDQSHLEIFPNVKSTPSENKNRNTGT